jgi:hypothetical protein
MQATKQLGIEEEVRHAQKVVGLVSWSAGVALAVAVAWHGGHVGGRGGAGAGPASFVDWSLNGTGDAVEVDGTIVMPEDQVVSHHPYASGAAETQKP